MTYRTRPSMAISFAREELKLARMFGDMLRAHGVPDLDASAIARRQIDLYRYRVRRRLPVDDMFSLYTAELLAEDYARPKC